jgi:transcriptional repressor NrdR
MKCPRCKENDVRVIDSRVSASGSVTRRRRECMNCIHRFTTYERIEESTLRVVKKNGERVRFELERVVKGMWVACQKLSVPFEEIEKAAARVEACCQNEYDREVESTVIGAMVMDELRELNQVAYVRFASVYREFKDVTQFLEELEDLGGEAE